MRFAESNALFLLFLLPALAVFFLIYFRQKARHTAMFSEKALLAKISTANARAQKISAFIITAACAFLIMALARPQFGTKLVEVKERSSDIVIAVDVSTSMLAQDLKPTRLDKAKLLLSRLVQQLGGNRIGIVAFAGTAFWQCPLTLDISGVNMFLDIMDTSLIPLPGTSIGSAINLSSSGLAKAAPKSKAIVLLTDGEDHHSDPEGAAAGAARQGIKIYTIGFGNPSGEPIPVLDEHGKFTEYKKNKKGEVIMSKMDESLLSKISAMTGGEYFRASDGDIDTARLVDDINGLEKVKTTSRLNRQYEERYQYFLFLGLALLILEILLPKTVRETSK